jgi:sodium transport system permease protein
MRGRIVWTIYRKEIVESLRDRRTLFLMIVLPILLYPLLLIGMSKLMESQEEAQEARTSRVSVWGAIPGSLVSEIQAKKRVTIELWGGIPEHLKAGLLAGRLAPPDDSKKDAAPDTPLVAAARPLILNRRFDAVVVFWPGFEKQLESGGLGNISLLYDSVRQDSRTARQRLESAVSEFRRKLVERRETQAGLEHGFATAVRVQAQNVAPSQRKSGFLLGSLLPYILIMFTVFGGFYPALDVTTGEKERGTMQTLLCAPLRSTEIIAGKFLTVWSISLIASLVNIASMSATFARIKMPGVEMSISPSAFLLTFALLAPVSLMATSIFLALGAFAKDFKEGQNYMTPVMMALTFPMLVTTAPGIELNAYIAFVPVVNIALLIKSLFVGEVHPDLVFLTLLASAMYAALAFLVAARVFERENVLLGGKVDLRGLFAMRRGASPRPTPGFALFGFALVLVLAFYGSLLLTKYGAAVQLMSVEFGFFLLPCLAMIALGRFPWRETLALRLPPWRGLLASVLLGCAAWTVASGVLLRLLPPPESLVRALEQILLLDRKPVALWVLRLAVGLMPGVCEELFFRGFVMSGFRRLGKWPAILLAAFLFALAHASIYRLLPTLWLGMVFGYAVWKTRSVVCGIVAHTLNNALMVTLVRMPSLAEAVGAKGATALPWSLTLGGAVLTVAALALLASIKEQESA